jgi:alpha-beta hydrolase superfamily lysophospholipase
MVDYSAIDRPELLVYVFYPRDEKSPCPRYAFDLSVPVEDGVSVACRFFEGDKAWPWILYFHGNGEVVSDYDEIAPIYFKRKLNLVVADYRGYGASTGEPTFGAMVHDAPVIFRAVREELAGRGFNGKPWVMGRSLGSISALELASQLPDEIPGLIIESGFISVVRVMRHLDVPVDDGSYAGVDGQCVELVGSVKVPALVIHGEYDTIVPYPEGVDLFERLGSETKEMITIAAADHNTIFFIGLKQYFDAILRFMTENSGTVTP